MLIRTPMLAMLLALAATIPASVAQEPEEAVAETGMEMLTIGSQAPALDIEHWFSDGEGKFPQVTAFENGKVYMVEFWATWCGPCIASMPRISQLQQEYADAGLQIISVSDEDVETVESFLDGTVPGQDETTFGELTRNYCLTTDPDGSVARDYMAAAGQNGIPTAFIIGKSGQIEWIGHPMEIQQPLEQVIHDQWDREEFAVSFRAEQEFELMMAKLNSKMQAGKTGEVIDDLTAAIDASKDTQITEQLKAIRAQVQITTGAEGAAEAMEYMTGVIGERPDILNRMAWAVVELHQEAGREIDPELVAAAAAAAQKALDIAPNDAQIIDTLAHLVHMQGNLDQAIELAEKAAHLDDQATPGIAEFLEQLRGEKSGSDDDQPR